MNPKLQASCPGTLYSGELRDLADEITEPILGVSEGAVKNGGCVKRLESAKHNRDFLKEGKVGYVEGF